MAVFASVFLAAGLALVLAVVFAPVRALVFADPAADAPAFLAAARFFAAGLRTAAAPSASSATGVSGPAVRDERTAPLPSFIFTGFSPHSSSRW